MTQDTNMDRMEIGEIFKLLPHRYPFLLIDRIIDIESDDRATGVKNVTFNEPHFNGHFPDQPIMPGVLIVRSHGADLRRHCCKARIRVACASWSIS